MGVAAYILGPAAVDLSWRSHAPKNAGMREKEPSLLAEQVDESQLRWLRALLGSD